MTNTITEKSEVPGQPNLRTLVLSEPSVLEPLILFCTHALRMRDSRCCTIICRVLQSIVPTFRSDTGPSPQVREFISTEVLKAAIMSLNEPYFVDVQKDLANLIACIVTLYAVKTDTVREVLGSLPDMNPDKVVRAIEKVLHSSSERQQRAVILELLEGVRGVSIHEAGRISVRRQGDGKGNKNAMQQQFMEVEKGAEIVRGNSPGLDGLAGMFQT
jgi:exportin-5